MKIGKLSNTVITLHWNLSKERITLGGAMTLRAECEIISKFNGQRNFSVLISSGANHVKDIKYLYETVFESSILVFKEIKTTNDNILYPDSYLATENTLSTFSTERVALLFKHLKVRPQLDWSGKINSEVDKILGTLNGQFICLSLKLSGLRIEDGDAEITTWREIVKKISIDLGIQIVIIGNDPIPEEISQYPRVRFLSREGISLAVQLALSERACLYIGVASGMATAVTFNRTPYLLYKHPEYHPEFMRRELATFDSLPWANRKQKIYRIIPDSTEVVAQIERILDE